MASESEMKYGFTPTNPVELLGLLTGQVPVPLIDAVFSLMKARAIMAAVRLHIFEAMATGTQTAQQIGAKTNTDAGALEMLLRVLAFFDYVEMHEDRFALSTTAKRSFVKGAPQEMFGYLMWNYQQWDIVEHMEPLLRTGKGLDFHRTMTDPEAWASYQRGMLELAKQEAPLIAKNVPVKRGATKLLDIAGSHGLMGAELCKRHPPMKATVLDLPSAVEHAVRLAKEAQIDHLVEHKTGDLLRDDFGKNWDVVLLSNILHHFLPGQNQDIVRRVKAACSEGASVAIWELEVPEKGSKPGPGDVAALLFRLTSNAAAYRAEEYEGWLKDAGFKGVESIRSMMSPGNVLVVGRA